MARNLSTTLSDLDSAITAEHNAWAAFAGYAENAHLAAETVPRVFAKMVKILPTHESRPPGP